MFLLSACGSNVSKESDPTSAESMLTPTPSEDLLTPAPSEEALTRCDPNYSPPPPKNQPVAETSTPISSDPEPLTKQEIYDVDVFNADWTHEQMESIGLIRKSYEGSMYSCYDNKSIVYGYLDFEFNSLSYSTSTPWIIKVLGDDIIGPRGLRIGNTFEEVMALFPQEQDWEINEEGVVFYGTYINEPDEPALPYGKITTYNGFKQIDISTENGPFIRMDFPEDILTQYTIYMYQAT